MSLGATFPIFLCSKTPNNLQQAMPRIYCPNLLPVIASLAVAAAANAQYFEARNNAMGGVGAASSRYLAAGWANPAC